jgi:hypothetical protein
MPPGTRSWSWRVFLTCWLVYTVFWTPYIVREHFPAVSLAENGNLNVERYLGWTDDIFEGPRGGAYINNNPGASLTGAIPLLLLRPLFVRVDDWNQNLSRATPVNDGDDLFWRTVRERRAFYFLLVAFVTVALVMAPATAGTAAYLCSRIIESGVPGRSAALAAVLYGLGTPVFFRSGYLNHNLLVADAGFTAVLLLWNATGKPLQSLRAGVAGLLAGYCVLCDYSGVVVVAVLALYVWLLSAGQPLRQRWRLVLAYGAGVIPGIAALQIYQAVAFGSFILPSQHYMAPTSPTSHGYRGFDWPSPALIWANFFDPRFGLFAFCPALILAFAAPFVKRVRYRVPPRETWIILVYFALFVLFCAANQYSWLQPLTGFRYLVPVVPGLALLAIQTAQALPAVLRWLIAIASCLQSVFLAGARANNVTEAAGTWWRGRFGLFWLVRLGNAGLPVTWVWTLAVFSSLFLLLVLIWRRAKV